MMKKVFCAAVSIFLVLFSTSCSKKQETSAQGSDSLTLALRAGTYSEVIKKCIPGFEEKYGIKCNVLELGEDALHSLISDDSVNENGKYDLCMVDGSWMAEYISKDVLADLGKLGYELDDDVITATKSICYSNGSLYLAPYYGNVTVLLYNKLMIKEAGYKPEDIRSLDDILKICQFQEKRHNLGFLYRGDTPNNIVVDFLPILCSYGGWVVDENNNPTINNAKFRAALQMYKGLIETGRAVKKEDLIAAVANKAATMGVGWPGWYTPTRNSSMDYLAISGRAFGFSIPYNANIYGVWTIGIPKNSGKKESAAKLLSYLMEPELQKATVPWGGVPCRYSSLNDPVVLAKFPQYEVICKALEGGVYRPVMQEWSQFYTILGKEMKRILDDEISVDEGVTVAQEKLEELMSGKEK